MEVDVRRLRLLNLVAKAKEGPLANEIGVIKDVRD